LSLAQEPEDLLLVSAKVASQWAWAVEGEDSDAFVQFALADPAPVPKAGAIFACLGDLVHGSICDWN